MQNDNCRHRRYLVWHLIWSLLGALVLGCVSLVLALGPAVGTTSDQRSPQTRSNAQLTLSAEEIREAEQRLCDLGYWTGAVDGVLDEGSRHALVAFQKVEDRQRTAKLTADELQAL